MTKINEDLTNKIDQLKDAYKLALKGSKEEGYKKGREKALAFQVQELIDLSLLEEIREEGYKEGIKQRALFHNSSIEKTRKESYERGLKEGSHKKLKKMIQNMLNEKLSLPLISTITGLSEREIQDISINPR